jgi:hypothetical protein
MWGRFVKIADALSQLGNAIWCFVFAIDDTTANESISGRCYRKGLWFQSLVNVLFFFHENHCRNAYLKDVARAKELVRKHDARV